jgi:hypothetical protein
MLALLHDQGERSLKIHDYGRKCAGSAQQSDAIARMQTNAINKGTIDKDRVPSTACFASTTPTNRADHATRSWLAPLR